MIPSQSILDPPTIYPPAPARAFSPDLSHAAVDDSGADGSLALRASAFLLLATLCATLGVRAFPSLPRFFPAMLRALEAQSRPRQASLAQTVDQAPRQRLLWTSALSAVATVAASLPSFLSPYLGRIIVVALRPAASDDVAEAGKQTADRVLSLLASGVEPRLLIPAVCGAYAECVGGLVGEDDGTADLDGAAKSVGRLLAYVQEVGAGLIAGRLFSVFLSSWVLLGFACQFASCVFKLRAMFGSCFFTGYVAYI